MVDVNLVEVETEVGPLLSYAEDAAIIRAMSTWEEKLGAQIRSLLLPGMTAVEVGGNIGYAALLMAERVGPSGCVVAVEPDPRKAHVLRLNAERARGAPIEVVEASAWSDLRLDDVLPSKVDLMLMDRRASEHVALRGAQRLLERSRPVLFAEFWPQKLRESTVDPVTLLDEYRAMGLRASGAEKDLPTDPGELVLAVDASQVPFTTLRLEPVGPKPPPHERLMPAGRRLGRTWARRFPPVEPRTLAYDATHRGLVSSLLDSDAWLARFASGAQLPPGLGAGFDERVVEYPWLFSRGLSGRVLDAGSVLNHRHIVERLRPSIDDLTIVTLAPEPSAFTELGIAYLYDDLRRLPLPDGSFDEVVCLSTLEHVGMDNSVYGAGGPSVEDPRPDAAQALRELLRVVRPGGRVHLSVPFGRREDHGWLRQLDGDDVDDLLARAGAGRHEEAVFRYTPRGWRRSTSRRVAGARYNDQGPVTDGVVAASAVLCVTIFV